MKYDPDKYTYRIEWSVNDQLHIARCLEFPSLAAHGETSEKALKEIEFVVTESIRWIEEDGGVVPEPLGARHYKGNITLRVPPGRASQPGHSFCRTRRIDQSTGAFALVAYSRRTPKLPELEWRNSCLSSQAACGNNQEIRDD